MKIILSDPDRTPLLLTFRFGVTATLQCARPKNLNLDRKRNRMTDLIFLRNRMQSKVPRQQVKHISAWWLWWWCQWWWWWWWWWRSWRWWWWFPEIEQEFDRFRQKKAGCESFEFSGNTQKSQNDFKLCRLLLTWIWIMMMLIWFNFIHGLNFNR